MEKRKGFFESSRPKKPDWFLPGVHKEGDIAARKEVPLAGGTGEVPLSDEDLEEVEDLTGEVEEEGVN